MTDPHNLQRFVDAQAKSFDAALGELEAGRKTSHWIWFIFPQRIELGQSATSRFYGIRSVAETRAYLEHKVLGERLSQCLGVLEGWANRRTAEQILGKLDSLKLRSCLTLFDFAAPDREFSRVLLSSYAGERDPRTLALLIGEE